MRRKIFIGLATLASMIGSTSFAQDIYKTAAGVPLVQLNNGILMPQFGLGTFLQPSDEVCEQSCLTALRAGYRHIDTAHAYNDEKGRRTRCEDIHGRERYAARTDLDYLEDLAYGIRRGQDTESDR